jgi:RNA polymerase sigma-70 factor (ECF subfamily)
MPGPIDAELIAEYFERHGAALEFYASQWTQAAGDCVQESYLEFARLPELPPDPAAWLFRVVRHRALNAARAARRRTVHEQVAAQRNTANRPIHSPAETVALRDLLQSLQNDRRELIILRIWGRLTWEEIATVTQSSRSSAQRNFLEALEQLRQQMEPRECPTNTTTDLP